MAMVAEHREVCWHDILSLVGKKTLILRGKLFEVAVGPQVVQVDAADAGKVIDATVLAATSAVTAAARGSEGDPSSSSGSSKDSRSAAAPGSIYSFDTPGTASGRVLINLPASGPGLLAKSDVVGLVLEAVPGAQADEAAAAFALLSRISGGGLKSALQKAVRFHSSRTTLLSGTEMAARTTGGADADGTDTDGSAGTSGGGAKLERADEGGGGGGGGVVVAPNGASSGDSTADGAAGSGGGGAAVGDGTTATGSGAPSVETKVFAAVAAALLFADKGSFSPELQLFTRGSTACLKRLAVGDLDPFGAWLTRPIDSRLLPSPHAVVPHQHRCITPSIVVGDQRCSVAVQLEKKTKSGTPCFVVWLTACGCAVRMNASFVLHVRCAVCIVRKK
jgi:hypothetical protein